MGQVRSRLGELQPGGRLGREQEQPRALGLGSPWRKRTERFSVAAAVLLFNFFFLVRPLTGFDKELDIDVLVIEYKYA